MDAQQSLRDKLAAREAELAKAAAALEKANANSPEARRAKAQEELDAVKAEIAAAERAEISKKLDDDRDRASHDALLVDIAPMLAEFLALFKQARPLAEKMEARIMAQHDASAAGQERARTLGEYADIDPPVSVDLVRAMVGVTLTQHLIDSDYRTPHARGFYRWLEPRWDRGIGAVDQQLIREARALALPSDVYTPTNPVDFSQTAADVAPWEVVPQDRPARWEV